MGQYLGPDVSLKDTAIAIREDGNVIAGRNLPKTAV